MSFTYPSTGQYVLGNASGVLGGTIPSLSGFGSILAVEAQAGGYFGALLSGSSTADGMAAGNRSGGSSGAGGSFYKTYIGGTTYGGNQYQSIAYLASYNCGGTFVNYSTSGGSGVYAQGRVAAQAGATYYSFICDVGGVYLNGFTVAPFTASHDALVSNDELPNIEIGDIVYDKQILIHQDISNTGGIVSRTTNTNEKAVLGVISEIGVAGSYPGIYGIQTQVTSSMGGSSLTTELDPQYQDLINNNRKVSVNAVGEGMINVCNEGGNIEAGDYITSSSIPGKGMKQADDLMHNYTVAKARESYTFTGNEIYQLACSYHCG